MIYLFPNGLAGLPWYSVVEAGKEPGVESAKERAHDRNIEAPPSLQNNDKTSFKTSQIIVSLTATLSLCQRSCVMSIIVSNDNLEFGRLSALGERSHFPSCPSSILPSLALYFFPPPPFSYPSMQGPPSPTFSRRPGQTSVGRPNLARTNSFQRQLVTSGPTPPSLVHSHYLEDPQSIFNGGAGWRHARNNQLTPPNEHDKLCLLDTVPMSSRSTSSSSAGSAVSETGQLVPAANRRTSGPGSGVSSGSTQRTSGGTSNDASSSGAPR